MPESLLLTDNATPASGRKWSLEDVRRVFKSDDVFATTLLTFCIDVFTMECLDWTPGTLQHELELDYGIKLPQDNLDKLLAAMQILETDDFYQRLPMFCPLVEALCGNGLHFETVALPDAMECAWAIAEALNLSPPEDGQTDVFVPEICAYIARVCQDEGLVNPPEILRIAGKTDQMDYAGMLATGPVQALAVMGDKKQVADEIEETVREAMTQLHSQLRSLPLTNGKVEF